jgi:hypothetical protein
MKIPNRVKLLLSLTLFFVFALAVSVVSGATNATATPTPSLPFGIPIEDTIFLGAFLGVTARTLWPYLAKARAAAVPATATTPATPAFTFDKHFLYTAVVGVIQAGVVTVLLFQSIPPLQGFFAAFSYAYASQDAINNQL